MINISDYILEKQSFLVKNHINHNSAAKIVKLGEYYIKHNSPKMAILVYDTHAKQFEDPNADYSLDDMNTFIITSGTESEIKTKFPTLTTNEVGTITDDETKSKIRSIIKNETGHKSFSKKTLVYHFVKSLKVIVGDIDKDEAAQVPYVDLSDFV